MQIEEPVAGRYASAFHFHAALTGMLGPTLIGNQVVEVREPDEKRLLTAVGMVKRFHHKQFPVDSVMRLIEQRTGHGHSGVCQHRIPPRLLVLHPASTRAPLAGPATGVLRRIRAGFVANPFHEETNTAPPPELAGVARLQSLDFGYDPARNVQSRIDRGQDPEQGSLQVAEVFGYDDLNRLAAWTVTSPRGTVHYTYHFDAHGNLELRVPDAWRGRLAVRVWWAAPPRPHAVHCRGRRADLRL